MRWSKLLKAIARSIKKAFVMIEKLFCAFRSVLTFPSTGEGKDGGARAIKLGTPTSVLSRRRLCLNRRTCTSVILSASEESRIFSTYEKQILRLRLRMTL
jgi:hypothetical protein